MASNKTFNYEKIAMKFAQDERFEHREIHSVFDSVHVICFATRDVYSDSQNHVVCMRLCKIHVDRISLAFLEFFNFCECVSVYLCLANDFVSLHIT